MLAILKNFSLAQHWKWPLARLAILLTLLFLLYQETVVSITSIWWRSDTYAHGLFIIPISLYMIWVKRQCFVQLRATDSWWGVALLFFSIVLWLLGNTANVLLIQQLALLCMIWSVTLGILGWPVVRNMLFPLAYLIFTIPMGEGLIPVLMDLTVVFTVKALVLTNIPVYSDGFLFFIPSGNFEVAKSCSGIRYLFASISVGSLFAYINFNSNKKRLLFILLSTVLPVIANVIRAYGIVLIAHYSDMKYAVGTDHLLYGWLFFGIIMFLLFYLGSKWRDEVITIHATRVSNREKPRFTKLAVPILLTAIAATGLFIRSKVQTEYPAAGKMAILAPDSTGNWQKLERVMGELWKISFKGASHEVKTAYTNPPNMVQLYIGYYETESQDVELVNQINYFYDIRHWTESQRDDKTLKLKDNIIHLREQVIVSGEQVRVLWYWYDLSGFVTNSTYIAKLVPAWQRLIRSEQGGAVVVLMADVLDEPEMTVQQLKNFVNTMYPAIQNSLSEVRKVSKHGR